jgi:histidine ammonia-lyase
MTLLDMIKISGQEKVIHLGSGMLTIEDVVGVACCGWQVLELGPESGNRAASEAYQRMKKSREWVERAVEDNKESRLQGGEAQAFYGINTGFGAKSGRQALNIEDIPWVSRNLLVSHSVGVGDFLPIEVVRAAMLIRANSLAMGYSGVRPALVNTLVRMLNEDVCPAIPEYGSVGASGDLAPLSHLGLVISKRPQRLEHENLLPQDYNRESGQAYVSIHSGEGDLLRECPSLKANGKTYVLLNGDSAMQLRGIQQLVLSAKEGLAINNGTTFSTALAALALYDAENLLRHAEISAAMSLEALLGFRDAFLPHIQEVRGHQGQKEVATRIMQYTSGSTLLDGDTHTDPRFVPPQDAYSLRVTPQVLGAIWDGLRFIRSTVTIEINASTDNPMIFNVPKGHSLHMPRSYKAVSGGNFHGAPIAYAMDFLGILITDLGSLVERRIFRLVDPGLNHSLPPFLLREDKPGVTSGMMIPQYLSASLVSDCKTLAHPDSVDSIPTSANQEDHVSMSMNAARHARQIVDNIESVVAVELLCASLALYLRVQDLKGKIAESAYRPEEKTAHQRDRVDEIVRHYRITGVDPCVGKGCKKVQAMIEDNLYGGAQGLPELRQRTSEDRFLRPYIMRLKDLIRSQSLLPLDTDGDLH